MLTKKMQQTKGITKLIIALTCYLTYLITTYFISMFKDGIVGKVILTIVVGILAILMFYFTKTFKLFMKKPMEKHKITDVIFILMFISFLIIVVHPFENITEIVNLKTVLMINSILMAICAGVFEEFLVRLLMFDGLVQLFHRHKNSVLLAAIYSAVIFGLLHLSNLSFQSLAATCQQIFYAIAIGLMFSFIRIKLNGIGICVLLHILIDLQPEINTANTVISWTTLFIIFVPIILISILCLNQITTYKK